jgi:hypothetical protein
MIRTSKTIGLQALKVTMAAIGVSCLGVAVFAAPMTMTPKSKIASTGSMVEHRSAAYEPLSQGPAIQLGRAAPGEDEDCVRVTRITGPDGRIYVTRGLVCAN